MYKIKADGVVFYAPSSDDMALQVLSPKASFELNKAGSLTFTVLPGNVMYHNLHKLKTVVTLEQDDEIVFCGRVLETVTDLHNQKEVYCEGELAFLLDSLQRPYKFDGKSADLFRQLLTVHNEQTEDYKHFEPGIVTAVDDEDTSNVTGDSFSDTLSEIRSLLVDEHEGYLRVRRENGVRYLDYVSTFDQPCSQEINFGVNMIDIENKVNAQEVCTILVPVGKLINGEYTNIKKVNDGKDYIEDTEGVEKYGRIVKTRNWDDVTDPGELLSLGLKHMAKLKAETTLTITAIDMHACGVDVDSIHLGDTVHLHSIPHGLDKDEVCTAVELDIENPEKSDYTFGFPQESLTDGNANTVKRFSSMLNDQHRWLTETDEALNITVENVNLIGHRTTVIEGDFNAAKAEIALKAAQSSVDILEARVSGAEVRIDGAEAKIELKAAQSVVNKMGERVTAAEIKLDGAESTIALHAEEIKAKADKILLEGYVKATDLETNVLTVVEGANVDSMSVNTLTGGSSDFDEMWCGQFNGQSPTWTSKEVVTGVNYQLETATTPPFFNANGTQVSAGITYVKNVIITPVKETINFLGNQ
jgi:hypothetical protein